MVTTPCRMRTASLIGESDQEGTGRRARHVNPSASEIEHEKRVVGRPPWGRNRPPRSPLQWARKNVRQDDGRSGAGGIPLSFRTVATVILATRWPKFLSAPWIRVPIRRGSRAAPASGRHRPSWANRTVSHPGPITRSGPAEFSDTTGAGKGGGHDAPKLCRLRRPNPAQDSSGQAAAEHVSKWGQAPRGHHTCCRLAVPAITGVIVPSPENV
jgi:hypothetical protein